MRYLVAIPAYNAAGTLSELITRIGRAAPHAAVLIVDDGSTDQVVAEVSTVPIHILRHPVNRGKGEALRTALAYAIQEQFDAVVQMDADLQHEPESLPDFFRLFEEGRCDVIIGARDFRAAKMPLSRRMSNTLCSRIVTRFCGQEVLDSQSGYRLMSRSVIDKVHPRGSGYEFEPEFLVLAARAGFRIGAVPIATVYQDEQSHIHPWRDSYRFVATMVSLWRDSRSS